MIALETVSTVPADSDALACLPRSHPVADCIDSTCDFVPWYAWVFESSPKAFFDKRVAVTDAACLYFDADLPIAGLRDVAFHDIPISSCFVDLRSFHVVRLRNQSVRRKPSSRVRPDGCLTF